MTIRSEPRTIRPFFRLREAERALDDARLRLFEGEEPHPGPAIRLQRNPSARLEPLVLIGPSLATVPAGPDLPADRLELAVTVASSLPRRSAVLLRLPVNRAEERVAIPPDRLLPFLRYGKATIRVAVCLARERDPAEPGMPHRKGHWIAAKTFHLGGTERRTLFDVRRRTETEWRQAGYPPNTLFAFDDLGSILAEGEEHVATLFLHAEVFDRIRGRDDPIASALHRAILAQAAPALLWAFRDEILGEDDASPHGVLTGVLRRLSRAAGSTWTRERLKRALADDADETRQLLAACQAWSDCVAAMSKVS